MPFYHDIEAAVPPTGGGPVDKSLLRNAVTVRAPTVIADDENPSDLVCVDPVTGAAIIDLFYLGRIFHYDPTDLVTPPDGTTCLVSYEGRRYKLSDGSDVFAYSVLDNSLATPPGSPAIGDAYLVAAAATGAWAGHSNEVTFFTARGWEFIDFGIGRLIYIESLEAYFHRKTDGSWASGFGNLTSGTNTVPLSAAINFGRDVIVENITTTSPPGMAAVGTAYIVGPSATGAWAGQDRKLAICEVANTFTIYTPSNGWQAYDKSQNTHYTYNGSAWTSSSGAWVSASPGTFVASSSSSFTNVTSAYFYDAVNGPQTTQRGRVDSQGIGISAKKSGARLRITYEADMIFAAGGSSTGGFSPVSIGLFRDAEVNGIAWCYGPPVAELIDQGASTVSTHFTASFDISAIDAAAHSYYIIVMSGQTTSGSTFVDATTLTRRRLSVQEAA